MSDVRQYVITGVGVATPAGCDVQTFWSTLNAGKQVFDTVQLFEGDESATVVARVDDAALHHGLGRRQTKRLDRFTLLAISAAKDALTSSALAADSTSAEKIGIILGNCTGGWTFVEPQLYALYGAKDFDGINSYVATAWFPTAPQGEISILLGLGGFSKTIVAENISAGFAVQQALNMLATGEVKAMLVGGTEAPLTPLVYNACMAAGITSLSGSYRPFQDGADGTVLGEGAAVLIVEEKQHAIERGARIVAEIRGIGQGTSLEHSIKACLHAAQEDVDVVDYIVLDARGTLTEDGDEYAAIERVFGGHRDVLLSAPKSVYGNVIAASFAVDLVTACLALDHQCVPPTATAEGDIKQPQAGSHVVGPSTPAAINAVLINGRDNYGQSLSMLLTKPQ